MDEIRKAYDDYCERSEAIKEVGKKILDLVAQNNESIARYEQAYRDEPESSYYESWAKELRTENEMLIDIERYHRSKYLKDARNLYQTQGSGEVEVW